MHGIVINSTAPLAEMPRYRSHKIVRALCIAAVEPSPANCTAFAGVSWDITVKEPGYHPVIVPHEFVVRHAPKPGMYLVVYEDGFTSVSPAEAFEAGYTRAEEWGIQRAQEPKYGTDLKGRIVNRKSGQPVPDGEPVFILRAKDLNALATLAFYRSLLSPGTDVMASVDERILAFSHFREMNPLLMKHPDSKPPIPPEPTSIAQAPRTPERPRAPWPFPSTSRT